MSRHTLKQRMSLACYDTVTNKMVGVNWLWVISREDDFGRQCEDYVSWTITVSSWRQICLEFCDLRQNLTPGMRACYNMIDHFCHDVNVFTKYGVNEYLGSNGLGVSDEYKGLGIAREILRARYGIIFAIYLLWKITHAECFCFVIFSYSVERLSAPHSASNWHTVHSHRITRSVPLNRWASKSMLLPIFMHWLRRHRICSRWQAFQLRHTNFTQHRRGYSERIMPYRITVSNSGGSWVGCYTLM